MLFFRWWSDSRQSLLSAMAVLGAFMQGNIQDGTFFMRFFLFYTTVFRKFATFLIVEYEERA